MFGVQPSSQPWPLSLLPVDTASLGPGGGSSTLSSPLSFFSGYQAGQPEEKVVQIHLAQKVVEHRSDLLTLPSGPGAGGTGEACAGDGSACRGTGRATELSANLAPAERRGCRASALEPDSVQIAKDYFVTVARLKTKKKIIIIPLLQ